MQRYSRYAKIYKDIKIFSTCCIGVGSCRTVNFIWSSFGAKMSRGTQSPWCCSWATVREVKSAWSHFSLLQHFQQARQRLPLMSTANDGGIMPQVKTGPSSLSSSVFSSPKLKSIVHPLLLLLLLNFNLVSFYQKILSKHNFNLLCTFFFRKYYA